MAELAGIYHRADIYDAVYRGRGKDYQTDAKLLATYIRERNPAASSLLDVACGTGSHLRYFADEFGHVEGVDLSEDMLRVARSALPGTLFHLNDMRDFRLHRRFDAITCLFSSIGYLDSAADLMSTLRCFASHLNPGGVVIVEPWWFPENAAACRVVADTVTAGPRTIARVSHVLRDGRVHRMQVHYLVAEEGSGIQHFTDTHLLSIFDRRQYEAAFAEAGCSVEHIESDQFRAGLFRGVKRAEEGGRACGCES